MSLNDYLIHASKDKALLLKKQWSEAITGTVTCPCGQLRTLELAYRCLYCGLWLCFSCAEEHFGQKYQDWIIEKRIKSREKHASRRNPSKD